MNNKFLKRISYVSLLVFIIGLSCVVIVFYDGKAGSKHIGGIINLAMAVGFVHLVDLIDDRWSLYRQIIHEQNIALATAYAGWIIGATIAFPSSIL